MAAFNRMQARLRRFVDDRTRMLAAISHDLRTPITSLRLRAEFVEDEETGTRMLATLDEMQKMVEATLAFAREEAAERADPDGRPRGAGREHGGRPGRPGRAMRRFADSAGSPYACRPAALRRALAQPDRERRALRRALPGAAWSATGGEVRIVIEDDGPGIPED